MSNLMTVIHQVNILKSRLDSMSEGDLSHGRIRIILDSLEMIELTIDRRKVKREVQ